MKKLTFSGNLDYVMRDAVIGGSATNTAQGGLTARQQHRRSQQLRGFVRPSATNTTWVDKVKTMRDDTHVTLQGNIVERFSRSR